MCQLNDFKYTTRSRTLPTPLCCAREFFLFSTKVCISRMRVRSDVSAGQWGSGDGGQPSLGTVQGKLAKCEYALGPVVTVDNTVVVQLGLVQEDKQCFQRYCSRRPPLSIPPFLIALGWFISSSPRRLTQALVTSNSTLTGDPAPDFGALQLIQKAAARFDVQPSRPTVQSTTHYTGSLLLVTSSSS